MKKSNFELKFTIASRTLLSAGLSIIHWDAFGKADTSNFQSRLPATQDRDMDGYFVHSVAIADTPDGVSKDGTYIRYIQQRYPRYITKFTDSFEAFLGTKSSKTRSTLRRKVRKFTQASDENHIDWRQYSTASEINTFFDIAVPLANKTYQARLFDGALPNTEDFRHESIELAKKGELQAFLLFLGAEAVAYLYAPVKDNIMLYGFLGYDDRVANLSPGTVLQYLVHEKLFQDKTVKVFDFTEGDGPHKALFATESTNCCNILYLKKTVRNRCLVGCHRIWNTTIDFCKSLADRFKLKNRIKGVLRRPGST